MDPRTLKKYVKRAFGMQPLIDPEFDEMLTCDIPDRPSPTKAERRLAGVWQEDVRFMEKQNDLRAQEKELLEYRKRQEERQRELYIRAREERERHLQKTILWLTPIPRTSQEIEQELAKHQEWLRTFEDRPHIVVRT